jgi:mannose-6-phosphate isomerase-like protein (cupin superfamily)
MEKTPIIEPPRSRLLRGGRVLLLPREDVGEHVTEGREELIVVLRGRAALLKEDKVIELKEGEAHFIGEGVRHNVRNDSGKELEYIYLVGLLA